MGSPDHHHNSLAKSELDVIWKVHRQGFESRRRRDQTGNHFELVTVSKQAELWTQQAPTTMILLPAHGGVGWHSQNAVNHQISLKKLLWYCPDEANIVVWMLTIFYWVQLWTLVRNKVTVSAESCSDKDRKEKSSSVCLQFYSSNVGWLSRGKYCTSQHTHDGKSRTYWTQVVNTTQWLHTLFRKFTGEKWA